MIDINKLKAGNVITRISHGNSEFTVGKDYCLLEERGSLYVFTDFGCEYVIKPFEQGYWEQLIVEEKPAQAHVKHLPMLLAYLEQHGIKAWYDYQDRKLICQAIYTKDGKAYSVLEEVDCNMRSVREWLGY